VGDGRPEMLQSPDQGSWFERKNGALRQGYRRFRRPTDAIENRTA